MPMNRLTPEKLRLAPRRGRRYSPLSLSLTPAAGGDEGRRAKPCENERARLRDLGDDRLDLHGRLGADAAGVGRSGEARGRVIADVHRVDVDAQDDGLRGLPGEGVAQVAALRRQPAVDVAGERERGALVRGDVGELEREAVALVGE